MSHPNESQADLGRNARPESAAAVVWPYIDPNEVLEAAVLLLGRVPGLLEKLADVAARKVADNESATLFDDLFERAASAADGAHYGVVGYRLRNPNEWKPVYGASDFDFSELDFAHE